MPEMNFADGSTWTVPGTAEYRGDLPSRCRSCGAPILWLVIAKSQKRAPFDPDGTNHFVTCPQGREWRKR